jgi:DNA repair photolyase
VTLITKSALIERDIDILAPMARKKLVAVTLSITTLDHTLSMKMEPRTSAPTRRLLAVKRLSEAGIPVNVNIAPVIPFLTDSELESIMEAAAANGAVSAFYNLVRLPWEVKPMFKEWLEKHYPLKAEHVMSRIRDMRDGRENDPEFGTRRERSRSSCASASGRPRSDMASTRTSTGWIAVSSSRPNVTGRETSSSPWKAPNRAETRVAARRSNPL